MKKVIVSILAFAFLFMGAQKAFAYVSWNNGSQGPDCPGSGIGNYSTGQGIPPSGSNDCWNLTSVSANPGNTINVQLYYHNTGTTTAHNTVLHVSVSPALSTPSTSFTFTSTLTSPDGGTSLGTTTVNLPSAQTLSFGSTYWYPNQTSNPTIDYSPTIMNGGLNIGDIAPGWPSQGSTVTSFTVSNTQPQTCVINNFSVTPTSVTSGQSVNVSWSTSGCISASVTGSNFSSNSLSGNQTAYPTSSGNFTITPQGPPGSYVQPQSIYVTVNQQQTCVISNFNISPTSVTSGQPVQISWATNGCTSVNVSGPNFNSSSLSNSGQTIYPTVSGNYTITAYGPGGSAPSQNIYVTVGQQQNCVISSFNVSPTSVTSGQPVSINWSTSNCTSVNVTGPNFSSSSLNNSGQTLYPTTSGNYTITASGANGSAPSQSIYVTVNQQQATCIINNFNVTPTSVTSGQPVYVSWSVSSGCVSVSLYGSNFSSNSFSGNQTVYPTTSGNFTIAPQGPNGTYVQPQNIYVTVGSQNSNCYISSFTVNNQQSVNITSGQSATLAWSVNGNNYNNNCTVSVSGPNFSGSGMTGSQTIYPTYSGTYTLTVYGSNSGNQTQSVYVNVTGNQYNNCTISYFSASPTSVNYGGISTLSWSVNNCNSISITNIGSVASYGSQSVYPTNTTTYTLTAYGSSNGSYNYPVSQSVQVYVNNYVPNPLPVPVNNTCAVTTVATNLTANSVTVNGMISNSYGYNSVSNAYFDYGTSVYLGNQTTPRSVGGYNTFSETITGLSPNTIYYFRANANCGYGISNGSINIFQTLGKTVNPKTVIVQGTTVVGTSSPIMLKIEDRYQNVAIGDTIDYTVTYQNIGKSKLTHPLLQVMLPKGVAFLQSSDGTYSSDTYTLSVPLNDLNPKDSGMIYLQGRVDSIDSGNAQIVTTAVLIYTNPKGAQENAIAYVLNNPIFGNSLVGLAFFGWFWNLGIIGWLMLVIIILLLVLIFRKYYSRRTA